MYHVWCVSRWALKCQNDKDHLRTQDNNTGDCRPIARHQRWIPCQTNTVRQHFRIVLIWSFFRISLIMDILWSAACVVCVSVRPGDRSLTVHWSSSMARRLKCVVSGGRPSVAILPFTGLFSLELHSSTAIQHAPWTLCVGVCLYAKVWR